jgi:ribose transport system permease protein
MVNYGLFLFLIVLILAFAVALPGRFATHDNVTAILSDQAVAGFIALAVTFPLVAGVFDLSVGATLGFVDVLSAYTIGHGMSIALGLLIAVAVGVLVGIVNAVIVVRVGVNAFIATLGIGTILSGGNLLVSQGATLFQGIPASLTKIGYVDTFLGLNIPVVVLIVVVVLAWYVVEHTPYGRYLRATGLSLEASRLSGVRTRGYLASSFIIAGALSAIAGFVSLAQSGAAPPTTGPEFLLPAYAAAFLGATTIKRGLFNVWGTIVGVFVLAIGINGLGLFGAPFWVSPIFQGFSLLVAVSIAVMVERRRLEHLEKVAFAVDERAVGAVASDREGEAGR